MKHFGRSLLNPTPASIPGTLATETPPGEPTSNATPSNSRRVDRDDEGMGGQGEFCCLLGGNGRAFRKAGANGGRS